ncbi:MAG: hypothetical protein ACI4WH_08520 [Oscillospiraceae bacterium]
MNYYGNDGHIYEIVPQVLSHGGEGELHDVKRYPHLVAKIFFSQCRNNERKGKVEALTKISFDKNFKDQIIVPQVALYEDAKHTKFVGYLMDKIEHKFVSLKTIYDFENDIPYFNKVRVAENLCIVTNLVHSLGLVIGDYNNKNIAVDPSNGRIKLIDVDSFCVTASRKDGSGKKTYRCGVGVKELIAPELQVKLKKEKADLSTITLPSFTEYTDRFALAIHIFALLMGGCNPFFSRVNMKDLTSSHTISHVDLDVNHAIIKGEFIFKGGIRFRTVPEYAPKYKILTSELQNLFQRAFVDAVKNPEVRPSSQEFYFALKKYYDELIPCNCSNPNHYLHKNYSGKCEWCRISKC